MDNLGNLNIYFWITLGLLTVNAVFHTYYVMKAKDEGYKVEIVGAVIAYLIFAVLLFKASY